MGKRYIIELPENTHWIQWFMEGTEDHHPYMDFKQVEDLTPYLELDLEPVRKEAYEKGLSDAWEAARKIAKLDTDEQKRLFGCFGIYTVAHEFSAQEAIEKIRQYEQEEIKIGDEVERILDGEVDSKAVFLEENNGYYHCMFWTGSFFTTLSYPKKQFRKTGRHFPEIAAVLEKMRGEKE